MVLRVMHIPLAFCNKVRPPFFAPSKVVNSCTHRETCKQNDHCTPLLQHFCILSPQMSPTKKSPQQRRSTTEDSTQPLNLIAEPLEKEELFSNRQNCRNESCPTLRPNRTTSCLRLPSWAADHRGSTQYLRGHRAC